MIKLALATVLFVFLFSAQRCNELQESQPDCVQSLIDQLKEQSVRNPPAKIIKYEIGHKTYYYIPPYCCDTYSDLYDDQCNLVCHPDGGFTGHGDGQCTELAGKISELAGKVIWEDKR